jgi:hypothetical protein
MSSWILGNNIGSESLQIEYKEFRLEKVCLSLYFNIDQVINIINNDLFPKRLHKVCADTLKIYISQSVSKYLSAYMNSIINNGTLLLGVSDQGVLTGVPIINNYTNTDIINDIHNTIKQIKLSNIDEQYILNNLKIEFIPLEINKLYLDDDNIDNLIQDYYTKYDAYITVENEYITKKQEWLLKITHYKRAINIIINEQPIRIELIKYISNSKYGTLYIRNNIIETLENINYKFNFKKYYIYNSKNYPTNITFWITRYRDEMVNDLICNKPHYHTLIEPPLPWFRILKYFRPMTTRWINNMNIKYQIIKLTYPCNNNNNIVSCIDKNGNLRSYYRILDKYERPCCI